MREIKFRARRLDGTVHNGRWVCGHYFTPPLTDENSGLPAEAGWYFLSGAEERHCIEQDGVVYTVDVKTLGQFTGFYDKNQKPIYDGDLIHVKNMLTELAEPYDAVVEWDKFRWCMRNLNPSPSSTFSFSIGPFPLNNLDPFGLDIEVIGNVHDNPELLEDDRE